MVPRNCRVNLFKFVGFFLAAVLGFTCLALFSSPLVSSPYERERQFSALAPSRRRIFHRHGLVDWKLFGRRSEANQQQASSRDQDSSFAVSDRLEPFEQLLLSGLPLKCHPGPEGLIPEKYARFVQALSDYTVLHDFLGKSSSSRTLVWMCDASQYCGGLGDRVRGITYALLLAMFSRRRLVIYWEEAPEGEYVLPHLIYWRDNKMYRFLRGEVDPFERGGPYRFQFHVTRDNYTDKDVNDVSFDNMAHYQRVIGSNSTNHVIISTNLEPSSLLDHHRNGGDQDWMRDGLQWTGLAHLSPRDLDDLVGLVFRYLFRIKDLVFDEMEIASEVLGVGFNEPYVSFHIRTGFAGMDRDEELVRLPKLEHDEEVWEAAILCAVATANRVLGNNSLIYLATDSNLVKHRAVYNHRQRIRSLQNELVHIDKLKKNHQVQDAKVKEGILVVWVELLLMAQGSVLLRNESGFPKLAGLLCGLNSGSNVTINPFHCTT